MGGSEQTSNTNHLLAAQKLIYLKYIKSNTDFMIVPTKYPKILEQLYAELNKQFSNILPVDWLNLMNNWILDVQNKHKDLCFMRRKININIEDLELLFLLDKQTELQEQVPSFAELSCILDHLEVAYSSPKVWLTISSEMKTLGASHHNIQYWKTVFEKWCNKVQRKKSILEQISINHTEKSGFLNTLEQRLLEFLQNVEYFKFKKEDGTCRVCLLKTFENLRNIYETCSDNLTIAQKISECANVQQARRDDGSPQQICQSCLKLLENAYKFKSLCEASDEHFKNITKNNLKEEYVEYIIETDDFQHDSKPKNNEEIDHINLTTNTTFIADDKEPVEKLVLKENEACIHQCEICGIICYNKTSLKKHMHIHSITRPHQCNICEKEFKTKLSLRIHMRCHTGERPYVCEVCGKSFTQESTLSYHRSIHSGEKKYMCNICDYRARNINDLKIHMRKHTGVRPYQCGQCSSKFTTSSNLQKHLRRHTGIKNFQCGNCGRSFFSRESARKHMVIHTGLKPYTCSECPMAYGWYNGLQKHMKTQHNGIKMPTEKYFLDLMDK